MLKDIKDIEPYRLSTYRYELPQELIAKYPVEPRDECRLLVANRGTGELESRIFKDIGQYLQAGDTLVLNDTRVIPARLYGFKSTGGQVELLLLKKNETAWETLVKPGRRVKPGTMVHFPNSEVTAEVVDNLQLEGGRIIVFHNCNDEEDFINRMGRMPLPPYINREASQEDNFNYQTVYARQWGSVAAPTAGLHFTESLLLKLQQQGINIARILLHVGLGTFRPVSSEDIRQHTMHGEYYEVDEQTVDQLKQTRASGHRIIAVGTTVVRTLETIYNSNSGFLSGSGETCKYIYPGYEFGAIDGIITNFHLPGSSLLMLVAAFAGLELTSTAYNMAVQQHYRFFSYGDAMLII
ncbi:MAG: tRNA preQ1(34) S-adenosylmethionine ribosyltransferase-isomerase QueA [Syntrophomonadaceae bacterium]|nr:tRNA preQ1(34) S-adenosylmethionine ribosyltransferase-isomerase QueA [Syntrophomonadaceae bacterium]